MLDYVLWPQDPECEIRDAYFVYLRSFSTLPPPCVCVYYVCICGDIYVSSVMYVPQDMCDFPPSSKQALLVDLPCRFQASWPESFWGILCIYLYLHRVMLGI